MYTKWLVMTAMVGAILTFASRADAMINHACRSGEIS
jgi:hypothetical protein